MGEICFPNQEYPQHLSCVVYHIIKNRHNLITTGPQFFWQKYGPKHCFQTTFHWVLAELLIIIKFQTSELLFRLLSYVCGYDQWVISILLFYIQISKKQISINIWFCYFINIYSYQKQCGQYRTRTILQNNQTIYIFTAIK